MSLDELPTRWNREDRDLLIELRTRMQDMQTNIKSLTGNTSARLLYLEGNTVSKKEFDDKAKDHEARIRRLERLGSLAIGALAVVQLLAEFLLK